MRIEADFATRSEFKLSHLWELKEEKKRKKKVDGRCDDLFFSVVFLFSLQEKIPSDRR